MKLITNIRRTRQAFLLSLALGLGALALGCGDKPASTTSGEGGDAIGGGGADTTATATATSSTTTGVGGEARVPPECVSPSGYQVCGGPYDCPKNSSNCLTCMGPGEGHEDSLGMCLNDASKAYSQETKGANVFCGYCRDGELCVDYYGIGFFFNCASTEIAQLFIANSGSARLRYADFSTWTGAPLPEPDDCPTIPDVPLCGGKCGGCASPDDICTGRSPLHPYGLCVQSPKTPGHDACSPVGPNGPCTSPDDGCFIWKVQPEHQDVASLIGYCLPLATCKAAAENLPGGGICWESP